MSNIVHSVKEERPRVLQNLSSNVRNFRQLAGLSQMALAKKTGVSRRMLAGIEAGDRNVSLAVLDKLASGLNVSSTDLIQTPATHVEVIVHEPWQEPLTGNQALLITSVPACQQVELWDWVLMPGEQYESRPDVEGWHEILYVIEGSLTLLLEQQTITLNLGDRHVFKANQRYTYANRTEKALRFIRNVTF